MKKKILSLIMALAMVMAFVPASYAANSGNCGADNNTYGEGTNATWAYDGSGTLTISGTGSVLFRLLDSEFNSEWVTKIIVSEGITELVEKCFDGCTSTKLVYIPRSMQTMGEAAVFYRASLEGIYYGGTQAEWSQLTLPNAFNGVPVYFNANPNNMTPAPTPTPGTVLAPEHDARGLYDMDPSAGTTTFHVGLPLADKLIWWHNVLTSSGYDREQLLKYTAEVYVYDANGILIQHVSTTTPITSGMSTTSDVIMNGLIYEGYRIRINSHFGDAYPV